MKKLFMIAIVALIAVQCNNETASSEAKPSSDTTHYEYAYLPANHPPDNWEPGDQNNVVMVLKSLKAFEMGNVEEALVPFADSVRWMADQYDAKISKDSLRAMFTSAWKQLASVQIKMGDYESVISKDKKDQYVTLWYKQINTDKSGKVDSMSYVDDVKIENGKIVELDEKSRRYPVK